MPTQDKLDFVTQYNLHVDKKLLERAANPMIQSHPLVHTLILETLLLHQTGKKITTGWLASAVDIIVCIAANHPQKLEPAVLAMIDILHKED
jgi:hypothetical protein